MNHRYVWPLAIVLCAAPLSAQDPDPTKVEIKVEKVAGSVYMLMGQGGNIAVSVGEDGILIVDDQFASLAPKIQAALKGIADKPVRFVLNTHWHFDHTGGNVEFGKASTLIAHENVRRRLIEGSPSVGGRVIPPAPKVALPVITFGESLTVHVNGEDVRALHYAKGHTDGDSIIYFPKSNVIHTGDDFVTYGLPFVDAGSGGSVLGMIENVEKAMASVPDDVKIIPGHGPLSTKADAKKFTTMLRDCVSLVQAGVKKGKTVDAIKAENPLGKYDPNGQGFVKGPAFAELIYNELKGDAGRRKQENKQHH